MTKMVHSSKDGLHPPPAPTLHRADAPTGYRPQASRGLRAPTSDASRQEQHSWACLGPAPPTTLVGSPRFRQFPDRALSRSDALAPEPSYPTPPFPSRSSLGLAFAPRCRPPLFGTRACPSSLVVLRLGLVLSCRTPPTLPHRFLLSIPLCASPLPHPTKPEEVQNDFLVNCGHAGHFSARITSFVCVPLRQSHLGAAQTRTCVAKHVLKQAPFRQGLCTSRPCGKRGISPPLLNRLRFCLAH